MIMEHLIREINLNKVVWILSKSWMATIKLNRKRLQKALLIDLIVNRRKIGQKKSKIKVEK